jgi:hypothetical protein
VTLPLRRRARSPQVMRVLGRLLVRVAQVALAVLLLWLCVAAALMLVDGAGPA